MMTINELSESNKLAIHYSSLLDSVNQEIDKIRKHLDSNPTTREMNLLKLSLSIRQYEKRIILKIGRQSEILKIRLAVLPF